MQDNNGNRHYRLFPEFNNHILYFAYQNNICQVFIVAVAIVKYTILCLTCIQLWKFLQIFSETWIYLLKKQIKRQRGEWENGSSMPWFRLQMPTTGWSQNSRIQLGFPMRVPGSHVHELFPSVASQGVPHQDLGIRSRAWT